MTSQYYEPISNLWMYETFAYYSKYRYYIPCNANFMRKCTSYAYIFKIIKNDFSKFVLCAPMLHFYN